MQSHFKFADQRPVIRINPTLTPELRKQMLQVQLGAFLKAYEHLTNDQLQIPAGMTKESWYTQLLNDDLAEVKAGSMSIIAVYIEDQLMGFATCKNVKARFPAAYAQGLFEANTQHKIFKNDVHISLLAGRPVYADQVDCDALLSLNIGTMLVNAVARHFQDANHITLDARHVNKSGNRFYNHRGFKMVEGISFEGHDIAYYRGYEKPTDEFRLKV